MGGWGANLNSATQLFIKFSARLAGLGGIGGCEAIKYENTIHFGAWHVVPACRMAVGICNPVSLDLVHHSGGERGVKGQEGQGEVTGRNGLNG